MTTIYRLIPVSTIPFYESIGFNGLASCVNWVEKQNELLQDKPKKIVERLLADRFVIVLKMIKSRASSELTFRIALNQTTQIVTYLYQILKPIGNTSELISDLSKRIVTFCAEDTSQTCPKLQDQLISVDNAALSILKTKIKSEVLNPLLEERGIVKQKKPPVKLNVVINLDHSPIKNSRLTGWIRDTIRLLKTSKRAINLRIIAKRCIFLLKELKASNPNQIFDASVDQIEIILTEAFAFFKRELNPEQISLEVEDIMFVFRKLIIKNSLQFKANSKISKISDSCLDELIQPFTASLREFNSKTSEECDESPNSLALKQDVFMGY